MYLHLRLLCNLGTYQPELWAQKALDAGSLRPSSNAVSQCFACEMPLPVDPVDQKYEPHENKGGCVHVLCGDCAKGSAIPEAVGEQQCLVCKYIRRATVSSLSASDKTDDHGDRGDAPIQGHSSKIQAIVANVKEDQEAAKR
jgi:hypothetical protein